ncbi:hypothetical protein OEA41_010163 [Lepraria neglecta]|uniref:Uncharacterized protein n=1 Tax=Lepraria neglecta TaxID=209136 RepID=A0AAE0DHG4_9LECA|nr:hypothetical protein OEA41_010163 [Lepraria neglecta]
MPSAFPPTPLLLAIIPEAAEAGVVAGDAGATAGEAGTAAAEGGAAVGEAATPTVADAMSADGGLLSNSIQDSSILEVLNARVGSDVTTDTTAASEASSILQTMKNAGAAVTPDEIASIPTGPGFTAAGDEGSTGSLAGDVPESAVPSRRSISSRRGAASANGLGAGITDGTNTK